MRVLILGGTTEASALAQALEGDRRFEATLSLAGVTRTPLLPRIETRIGGFGGIDGLAAWLADHRVELLIDATHPFARQISQNAVAASGLVNIPLLRVARPEWMPVAGDRWIAVPDMPAAAAALGTAPRRVLLTVGRKDLLPFRDTPGHHYIVRSVDAPAADLLPLGATVLTARGPFGPDEEIALLRAHGIETIVTKNSGGPATVAKLDAARRLTIPVVMVARPPAPREEGASVPDWQQALHWLHDRHEAVRTDRSV